MLSDCSVCAIYLKRYLNDVKILCAYISTDNKTLRKWVHYSNMIIV